MARCSMHSPRPRHAAVLLVAITLLAGAALPAWAAGGGPVLISQPKQFPVRITQPGGYQLAGNLTVPDADTTAIEIDADNVTIDLGGFSILGPVLCGSACAPSGSGIGIATGPSGSTFHSGITVRNGMIQGLGGRGIELFGNSHLVEYMHLRGNSLGMQGSNAIIRQNIIDLVCNFDDGIVYFGSGFLISDNIVTSSCGHASVGIALYTSDFSNGSVVRNIVSGFMYGLDLGNNTSYSGNVLTGNSTANVHGGINTGQNICDFAVCPGAQF